MTDIIQMAQEAGLLIYDFGAQVSCCSTEQLKRFAELVRADEREACARIASSHECGGEDDFICGCQNCGACIAGDIRARGE